MFTTASERHSATLMEIVVSPPPTPPPAKLPLVKCPQLVIQHTQNQSPQLTTISFP